MEGSAGYCAVFLDRKSGKRVYKDRDRGVCSPASSNIQNSR